MLNAHFVHHCSPAVLQESGQLCRVEASNIPTNAMAGGRYTHPSCSLDTSMWGWQLQHLLVFYEVDLYVTIRGLCKDRAFLGQAFLYSKAQTWYKVQIGSAQPISLSWLASCYFCATDTASRATRRGDDAVLSCGSPQACLSRFGPSFCTTRPIMYYLYLIFSRVDSNRTLLHQCSCHR